MTQPGIPLSNAQQEILKLYATDLSEDDLRDLKRLLADFYLRRARKAATEHCQEQGVDEVEVKRWLEEE